MCFKHVWSARALMMFCCVMSVNADDVQIDGLVDKPLSYQYQVKTPGIKDILKQETTQHETVLENDRKQQSRKHLKLQMQTQSQEQDLEKRQAYIQSRMLETPQTHEEPQINVDLQSQETPYLYYNSYVNNYTTFHEVRKQKQLDNEQSQESENSKEYERPQLKGQPRSTERFQTNDNIQEPSNPYVDFANKRLEEEHVQMPTHLKERQHSQEYELQANEESLSDRSQREEQIQIDDHSRSADTLTPLLKEDQQSSIEYQSQQREQLRMSKTLQNHERLQTRESTNQYFYPENKRLSDEELRILNHTRIEERSEEHDQLRMKEELATQERLRIQKQIQQQFGLQNQSRFQEQLQIQLRSQIKERSHVYNKKSPNRYFHSVNKRFSEEPSDTEESSPIHVNLQRQEAPSTYFNSNNQYLTNGHIHTEQKTHRHRHHKRQRNIKPSNYITKKYSSSELLIKKHSEKYETSNPYFQSINKRLIDEQTEKQESPHVQEAANKYIYSLNKRITKKDSEMGELSHIVMQIPEKQQFYSVNKRFTEESLPAQEHFYQLPNNNPVTTSRNFYSVNRRLTTEDNNNMNDQRDGSDTDSYGKKSLQRPSTKEHSKSHLHYHHPHTISEYDEYHEHGKEMDETHGIIGTVFQDLTVRKNKRRRTTTTHRSNHPNPHVDKITLPFFNDLLKKANFTKKKHKRDKFPLQSTNTSKPENITAFSKIASLILSNLTFQEIFTHPQKIKNNTQIKTFTTHILQSGLRVFAALKDKTTDYALKNKIDKLAEKYETKYKEFLTETCRHEIKTTLGKQKLILNAIDASTLILNRLVNFIVADLDQKGSLRENIGTAITFQQAVDEETKQEFNYICKKFGICRTETGYSNFLIDFLTTILMCDDTKFKLAMDSLTEVTKHMDFRDVFQKRTRHIIRSTVHRLELLDMDTLRPAFMVIKNIIANKNKPLVVSRTESQSKRINSTLALLEIVNILEEILPRTDANIIDWGDLRTSLNDWAQNKRTDITAIMEHFMRYTTSVLKTLPIQVREHLADNFERVLNVY